MTEQKEGQNEIGDEQNFGFGVSKFLTFLQAIGGYDDGEKEDEEIDLDRVDELGKKMKPLEQYRMMCHRFHGKNPSKNKIKRQNRLKAEKVLEMKMDFNDTPLGSVTAAKKVMETQHKAFVDIKQEKV
ncbi:hypothetical protein EIN_095930 [Entamoeba invadens IP1]|uniref:Uncharacterized protein n=1 Tax=Entamoeba invadens IP1 TaxID=370355 RepID=A0A0A1U673_ENTIV|nr:hypothetical protein EIN_095930 [Entamoeba invadens IP1]ELP87336.1 hypothetical protein EIN_095930 [Entamoeba invadens IP1]|eukprot:XP_004254107.1 hypothetical protein EIN_095930 [Entamoeba invadens IP1]